MSKKRIILVTVAAVAVLLVAAWLLLARGAAPTSLSGVAGPGGSASIVSTSPAGSGAASGTIAPLSKAQEGLPAIVASAPIAGGAPLPPLSSAPEGLVASYPSGAVPTGSAYDVIVRPWGLGPIEPTGRTVVVSIIAITPVGNAPVKLVGLHKRVVLAVMDANAGGTIDSGGTYSATLKLLTSGALLVPHLSKAKLLQR